MNQIPGSALSAFFLAAVSASSAWGQAGSGLPDPGRTGECENIPRSPGQDQPGTGHRNGDDDWWRICACDIGTCDSGAAGGWSPYLDPAWVNPEVMPTEEPPPRPDPGPPIICSYADASPSPAPSPACSSSAEQGLGGRSFSPTVPGYQGWGWFQHSRPELVVHDGAASPTQVRIYTGAKRVLDFKLVSGSSPNVFVGVNGVNGVVTRIDGSATAPELYRYNDAHGNEWTFFGSYTNGGAWYDPKGAKGQLWTAVNEDGGGAAMYTGHATNPATAISSGFEEVSGDATSRAILAYDGAGRRMTYAYTTVNSTWKMLSSVTVEVNTGSWTTVWSVGYTYYTSDGDYGLMGDLKVITETIPLTSGGNDVRETYFRYYTTNSGGSDLRHLIKAMVKPEGVRRGGGTAAVHAMNDSTIKNYADAFYEYNTYGQVTELLVAGSCGCGGSAGTYEFDSTLQAVTGRYTADGNGDTGNWSSNRWRFKTVVTYPGGKMQALFFDEMGWPLASVVGDGSLSAESSALWITKIRRDGRGRPLQIFTPEAIDWNNGSGAPENGNIIVRTGSGRVDVTTYDGSTYLPNAVASRKMKQGSDGTLVTLEEFAYASPASAAPGKTFGTTFPARLARPLVTSHKRYRAASTSDETTFSYTYHSGASAWAPKSRTATMPTLSGGDISGPTSLSTAAYFDKQGRLVLSKDGTGIFSYAKYGSDGLVTKRAADTTSGDTDSNTAAGDLGATLPSTGLLYITSYTYDAQGRMITATLPSGRVTGSYYTKLSDGRVVTLSSPILSSGSTTGPVDYTVHNQAGKVEAQGVLAVASSTAVSSLINSSSGTAVTAVQNSTLAQLTINIYDTHGTRLDESRSFYTIPSTEASTSGCEITAYGYDEEGHPRRVVDPTGTISRSVFDALGRVIERWVGTNDTGFPGSGNMVVVETVEYDGGGVGNGHVTTRTQHPTASSGDDRVTGYTYDYRGRLMVQANPESPHFAFKYDDAGRTLAVGGYSAAPGVIDPTSTATNRVSLSETGYNTRGQARLSTRHKITQSDGSSTDTLTELRSYDGAGRIIKVAGSQLTKTAYDALGRATHTYVLSSDNDSSHSDAAGLSGDFVIEEHQTLYDNGTIKTGNVLMTVEIARHPLDTTTTGALDAADSSIDTVAVASGSFKGRAQITSYKYDNIDRQTSVVAIGNNGGSTYTRSSDTLPGARSDTRLISETGYNTHGMATSTVDPRGIMASTVYDALGRVTKTIANYDNGTPGGTNGDEDQVVEYVYSNGLMTSLIARMPSGGDDQTTTYTYGVTTSGTLPSTLVSNRLLRQVQYPDSAGGSDVVKYAYNRLGQQTAVIDQAGNQIDTLYDEAGRELSRTAATITSGFDGFVNKIAMVYLARGPVDTVTQYGESGSSTVRDQVRYEYDGWGNLERFRQDVDSAMDGAGASVSGREAFEVLYTLAKSAPSGGVHALRRTAMTSKADGTTFQTVGFTYGSGSSITDNLSRVATVTVGSSPTTVAAYDYLGVGHLVGTTLSQASLRSAVYTESGGAHTYGDLDRFNRPTTWDWARVGGGTFYDVDMHYDRNSNPTATVDNVHIRVATSKRLFDVAYSLDNLNRVRGADEGHSTGTAPALTIQSSYHTRNETWPGLTLTGNWKNRQLDSNGDGDVTDPLDRDEPVANQAFNPANEWTGRHIEKAGGLDHTFDYTYDAVGNLIGEYEEDDLGGTILLNQRGYVYDAFGRMVAVTGLPGEETTYIEKHRYNGLGFRIMWQYDVDVDGTLEDPERYYFMLDERWRVIGTFRNQDASPKEAFVHHAAGQGGFGGSSYIDSIILRDRDNYTSTTPNPMSSAADGTLEERRYYCQNWRADVVAITKSDGTPLEYVRYSSYGEPTVYPVADLDMDGDVDTADSNEWDLLFSEQPDQSAYATADIDFDGSPSTSDGDLFAESYTANTGLNGKGRLSSPSIGNRLGYAGYHHDPVTRLYDVRHRWYFPEIGRWGRRDPLGYVDGPSLYQFVLSSPLHLIDLSGLSAQPIPISNPFPPPKLGPGVPVGNPGPGTGLLGPVGMCIQVACTFYCIGEDLSPRIFPDIGPVPIPPGKPAPNKQCQDEKRRKDAACGERPFSPGGQPPPAAPKRGMPNGAQPGSKGYCEELQRRIANQRECLNARVAVQQCFANTGIRDPKKQRHEDIINEERAKLDMMIKQGRINCPGITFF